MRKTKAKIIIILSIILMMVLSTVSFGANYTGGESFTANLKTASISITKGSKVDVIIELKDFVNIGAGINTFRAKLNYNKDVLSIAEPNELTLISADIKGIGNWGTVIYNPSTSLLVVDSGGLTTTNEDIIKITFTVNGNAVVGSSANITLTEVEAGGLDDTTGDVKDFKGLGSTLTLNVIETPAQEPDDGEENPGDDDETCEHTYTYTDNKDGTHTVKCTKCGHEDKESHSTTEKCSKCGYTPVTNNGGTGTSNGGNTNGGTNNKDNTTADKDYSKAGLNTILIIGVGCVVVAAIVLYNKNKKFQDIK